MAKRIVVKIGTNTITMQKGSPVRISDGPVGCDTGIDVEYLHRIAAEIADLMRAGRQVILVTSGAVGMGARELGLVRKPKDMKTKQACAAIGQPLLMDEYRKAFSVFGLTVGQLAGNPGRLGQTLGLPQPAVHRGIPPGTPHSAGLQ
jgi:glutamate 5-kinase